MFFSFFIDWSTEELGLFPHYYTWIIEYVLILLSIRVLGFALLKKEFIYHKILYILLIMIVLGTITSLMNGTTIFKIILGIRPIVKYVLLFLVILNSKLSIKQLSLIFSSILFFILIQFPIVMYQFFILGLNGDPATGSLRSSGIGMILQISMLCISLRLYTTYRKSLSYLLIITIMLVLPMIGESKAFFFLLPLILIYSFKKRSLVYQYLIYCMDF